MVGMDLMPMQEAMAAVPATAMRRVVDMQLPAMDKVTVLGHHILLQLLKMEPMVHSMEPMAVMEPIR